MMLSPMTWVRKKSKGPSDDRGSVAVVVKQRKREFVVCREGKECVSEGLKGSYWRT